MSRPAVEDKRIQFLKQDGTELYTEGDIAGATGLYTTAMQLEMDRALQDLTSSKKEISIDDPNDDDNIKDYFSPSEKGHVSKDGIIRVIEGVLEEAEEAIQVNPTLPKPYLSKATALLLQNKWDEARDVYTKGIASCGSNCHDLRKALQKLYKTQALLKSIPRVIERTSSVSSDVSECTVSDGRSSPSLKSRRFRIQHRKKLSRPQSDLVTTTNPELFKSKDNKELENENKNNLLENLSTNSNTL